MDIMRTFINTSTDSTITVLLTKNPPEKIT